MDRLTKPRYFKKGSGFLYYGSAVELGQFTLVDASLCEFNDSGAILGVACVGCEHGEDIST